MSEYSYFGIESNPFVTQTLDQQIAEKEQELAALKAQQWPQEGDKYYFVSTRLTVQSADYYASSIVRDSHHRDRLAVGNCFKAEAEAQAFCDYCRGYLK